MGAPLKNKKAWTIPVEMESRETIRKTQSIPENMKELPFFDGLYTSKYDYCDSDDHNYVYDRYEDFENLMSEYYESARLEAEREAMNDWIDSICKEGFYSNELEDDFFIDE